MKKNELSFLKEKKRIREKVRLWQKTIGNHRSLLLPFRTGHQEKDREKMPHKSSQRKMRR